MTVWFLLLSFLPLAVMTIFVRQTVSDTFGDLAADENLSQARLLAHEISTSIDDRQVQAILAKSINDTQSAFLVGETGRYLAHSDSAKLGGSVLNDFPAEVAEKLASGGAGTLIDPQTGDLISYSSVPSAFSTAVLTVDSAVVSAPMRRIERSAVFQLALSLALIVAAGSAAIWFVFKPIQQLTKAAQEVGAGNLDVQIDPSEMEGELEVLTLAFNQMTRQLQGAYEQLEQRVVERTEELTASELRYRTLFEESRDAIFIASEGKFVDLNEAALDLFGFTREEAVGSEIGDRFVDSVDRDRFRQVIGTAGSVKDFELKLRKRNGTQIDCLLTATRRSDEAGQSAVIQGVVRDITDSKLAEEAALQQSREVAVLGERNRMAREIHDTLAQGFTGIVLQLEAGEQAMETSPPEVADHLQRAKKLARESLQEARRTVWDLLPRALEGNSLEEALREEVNRFPAERQEKVSFQLLGNARELSSDVQTALLRLCQESLTNVRKHAGASEVSVKLTYSADSVDLDVTDNGKGFDVNGPGAGGGNGGFGLIGMEQRARSLGGEMVVKSQMGKGTQVAVKIPKA